MYEKLNKEDTITNGDKMTYIERIKNDSNNDDDYIYKTIKLGKNTIDIVNIETITSNSDRNNFRLKKISFLDNLKVND